MCAKGHVNIKFELRLGTEFDVSKPHPSLHMPLTCLSTVKEPTTVFTRSIQSGL